MIEDILNKMKKEMKNNINIKRASQDYLVIKTTSVERILFNQKRKRK
jgi:hypothetical protein